MTNRHPTLDSMIEGPDPEHGRGPHHRIDELAHELKKLADRVEQLEDELDEPFIFEADF